MSILETEYNEKAYGKTRYDEGLEQGKQDEKIETILAMYKKNLPAQLIAECTRSTIEEVNKLKFYSENAKKCVLMLLLAFSLCTVF